MYNNNFFDSSASRFRPHRGLFFYLFTEKECYIYAMNVSVPTGDFSFIYDSQIESEKRKIHVSVPTGDFSFIYIEDYIVWYDSQMFPSPPGTFLLSMVLS